MTKESSSPIMLITGQQQFDYRRQRPQYIFKAAYNKGCWLQQQQQGKIREEGWIQWSPRRQPVLRPLWRRNIEMDPKNKGCIGKAQTNHYRYQKGVLYIWCDVKIAIPNQCYDTEWREYNTIRSQVMSVASMAFRFLAQIPGSTDWRWHLQL